MLGAGRPKPAYERFAGAEAVVCQKTAGRCGRQHGVFKASGVLRCLAEVSGVGGVERRGVAARRGRARDRVVLGRRWLVKKKAWGWLFPCVFPCPGARRGVIGGFCRRGRAGKRPVPKKATNRGRCGAWRRGFWGQSVTLGLSCMFHVKHWSRSGGDSRVCGWGGGVTPWV